MLGYFTLVDTGDYILNVCNILWLHHNVDSKIRSLYNKSKLVDDNILTL